MNAVFRLFHSLKGTASFLELDNIIKVTHEAETLLDIFRKGKANVSKQHVDLLCRTSDYIRSLLDTVEQRLSDAGEEKHAEGIVRELKKSITTVTGSGELQLVGKPKALVQLKEPSLPADLRELRLEITPEILKQFTEEAFDQCDEAETALMALEHNPDDKDNAARAFRAMHSLCGNARFFGFTELERLSCRTEKILGEINKRPPRSDRPCRICLPILMFSGRKYI